MTLNVSNGTTLMVTLTVNGPIEAFPPGARDEILPTALPPLPWVVELRSPSGRLLVSTTIRAGDVWRASTPGGGTEWRGAGSRADLLCGRLDVWSGPPMIGPPPGPGAPGDCAP